MGSLARMLKNRLRRNIQSKTTRLKESDKGDIVIGENGPVVIEIAHQAVEIFLKV